MQAETAAPSFLSPAAEAPRAPILFLFSVWALLFAAGTWFYPGAKYSFILFSFSFLALLVSGFYRAKSYGYLFLAVFLWLGFWLKATVHFLFTYAYLEPTGSFTFTPGGWDLVMNLSSAGALALLASRAVYGFLNGPRMISCSGSGDAPPIWYGAARSWLWFGLISLLIGVPVINAVYDVHQIGLPPKTIFLWPGNALIAWILNIGGAMGLAALAYRDIASKRGLSPAVGATYLESLCTSVSMVSRGVFVYHAVPLVFALSKNSALHGTASKVWRFAAVLFFFATFAASIFFVNVYRGRLYADPEPALSTAQARSTPPRTGPVAAAPVPPRSSSIFEVLRMNTHLRQASGLFLDRWLGLEGVMAVTACPEKNISLLAAGLTVKRTLSQASMYERICGSDYQGMDTNKHQFGRIPGPIAFFYFSGRIWTVIAGVFALGLLVLFLESAVWGLTRNPLMCSLLGMMFANNAAQFGPSPVQMLPTYAITFIALVLLWLLENRAGWIFSSFGRAKQ